MKRKQALFSILSLIVMISAVAFKPSGNSDSVKADVLKPLDVYYFSYTGPSSPYPFDDYEDPDNYVLLTSQDPSDICEGGHQALCAIVCERYWNSLEWKPDFSNKAMYSTWYQLQNYFYYGIEGPSLFLKYL